MRCWLRILTVAQVSLVAFGVAGPASNRVNAGELTDAWINVFSVPEFTISTVVNSTNTSATGRNYAQTIEGTHESQRLRFYIQRAKVGFNRRQFTKKEVARQFRVERSEVTNYTKVKVRDGRGASVDYRGCRLFQAGVFGSAYEDRYEFVIYASTCGNGDQLAAFLAKMKPATRATNEADMAPYPLRVSDRAVNRVKCESAERDPDPAAMADFIGSISPKELTIFLAGKQSCSVF